MDELNHVLQSLNALSRLSLSAQEALGDCLIPVIFKKKGFNFSARICFR